MTTAKVEANKATLTVRELIDALYALPDLDKPILFSAASADYWQTRLGYRFIENNVHEMIAKWDDYHDEYQIRDPEEDDDGDFDGTVYVFC